MSERLLTLHNVKVTMYPILPDSDTRELPWGKADTENPVWLGAEADTIRLTHRQIGLAHRPTGSRYPRVRYVGEEHLITITNLWTVNPTITSGEVDTELEDHFVPERDNQYVLSFTWQEDTDEGYWITRVYYGVTCPETALNSGDVEFRNDRQFVAAFFKETRGTGTVPEE